MTYGYQRFDHGVMLATIVVLVALVALVAVVAVVQLTGDALVRASTPHARRSPRAWRTPAVSAPDPSLAA